MWTITDVEPLQSSQGILLHHLRECLRMCEKLLMGDVWLRRVALRWLDMVAPLWGKWEERGTVRHLMRTQIEWLSGTRYRASCYFESFHFLLQCLVQSCRCRQMAWFLVSNDKIRRYLKIHLGLQHTVLSKTKKKRIQHTATDLNMLEEWNGVCACAFLFFWMLSWPLLTATCWNNEHLPTVLLALIS